MDGPIGRLSSQQVTEEADEFLACRYAVFPSTCRGAMGIAGGHLTPAGGPVAGSCRAPPARMAFCRDALTPVRSTRIFWRCRRRSFGRPVRPLRPPSGYPTPGSRARFGSRPAAGGRGHRRPTPRQSRGERPPRAARRTCHCASTLLSERTTPPRHTPSTPTAGSPTRSVGFPWPGVSRSSSEVQRPNRYCLTLISFER